MTATTSAVPGESASREYEVTMPSNSTHDEDDAVGVDAPVVPGSESQPEAPPLRSPEEPTSRSRRLNVLIVVAVVLCGAVAGALALEAHRAQRLEDARSAALEAARTRIPALLSYQASRLESDLERAVEQTTGTFHDDYQKVLDDVVAPTASREGISTQAEVTAAGVVSASPDEVVVLVFLTQSTTANDERSTVTGSRVEVTMRRVGETWKVAGLEPQ